MNFLCVPNNDNPCSPDPDDYSYHEGNYCGSSSDNTAVHRSEISDRSFEETSCSPEPENSVCNNETCNETDLSRWLIEFKITRAAGNSLLKILKKLDRNTISNLPDDVRALKRNYPCSDIKSML